MPYENWKTYNEHTIEKITVQTRQNSTPNQILNIE